MGIKADGLAHISHGIDEWAFRYELSRVSHTVMPTLSNAYIPGIPGCYIGVSSPTGGVSWPTVRRGLGSRPR